jgi:hypothetical protein
MPSSLYVYDAVTQTWRSPGKRTIPIAPAPDPTLPTWSDVNVPWDYSSASEFTQHWPSGVTIVDIQTGSSDFYTNLSNTVNAASGRVVVRLQAGIYHLNQFRMIGSSGDPTYAFGFWFAKLQGFLGQGADQTFIQMDANSMSTAQLNAMKTMDPNDFSPLQIGLCRLDGSSAASPVLIAGVTFRAADQQLLTAVHPNLSSTYGVYTPQPAPHQGVVLFSGVFATISHVRFQGAGRAMSSAPPFEMANASSQYGTIHWYNCEFDGRLSPDLNAAKPRRCGVWMGNNEAVSDFNDCWFHHSNVSRYAANDQNRNTQGLYTLTHCLLQQITNTQNTDPAINGGASLGGWTNACPLGWESCNGTLTLNNCVVYVDNASTVNSFPAHLQLTSVGSRNPQGGRMYVNGGEFRHTAYTQLDEFITFRIQPDTYWWTDGFNTTLTMKHRNGQILQPYEITGSWPPSSTALANAGVTPTTHYLVKHT